MLQYYTGPRAGVDATFLSPWRFSVEGDRTAEFRLGQRLFAFCGEDGAKAVTIVGLNYTGAVTIFIVGGDRLTNQLDKVTYQREEELVNELVWEGESEPPDYFRGILWVDTTVPTTTTSSTTTTTTSTAEPAIADETWSYGKSIQTTEIASPGPMWSYGKVNYVDVDPPLEAALESFGVPQWSLGETKIQTTEPEAIWSLGEPGLIYDSQDTTLTTTTTTTAPYALFLRFDEDPFEDSSPNDWNITNAGGVTRSAVQSKYGGYSGFFDGGATGYLTIEDDPVWDVGADDFEISVWIYPTSLTGNGDIVCRRPSEIVRGFVLDHVGTALRFYATSNQSTWDICGPLAIGTATLNAWNHIIVRRIGVDFFTYLNDNPGGTTSSALAISDEAVLHVGSAAGAANTRFSGYIEHLKIQRG